MAPVGDPPSGRILTFYSGEYGIGRSMTLANVAWILAGTGRRVLVVDWDVELPGLHRYFRPFVTDEQVRSLGGINGVLSDLARLAARGRGGAGVPELPRDEVERAIRFDHHAHRLSGYDFPGAGLVDLLPLGGPPGPDRFDWDGFYRLGGARMVEVLAEAMRDRYDDVLIDSPAGSFSAAGVCNLEIADAVVVCFTMRLERIDEAAAAAEAIRRDGRGGAVSVLPVPLKVEDTEQVLLEECRDRARQRFGPLLDPSRRADDRYWDEVEIPFRSFYGHRPVLAALAEPPGWAGSLLSCYEWLTSALVGSPCAAHRMSEEARRRWLAEFERGAAGMPPQPAVIRRPGQGGTATVRRKLFISYVREDAATVDALADALRAHGVDVWLDRT
jgi:Mrp family chromosome partitioning ATPase